MALIKKDGNQIYKIYSPEMDISRSSLLSVSNDIAALTSTARIIYRYDNKLEDYDISWIDYNELNDAVDIWYKVPENEISEYYKDNYVRKTLYWNETLRLTEVIRYHEAAVILKRLPKDVTYDINTNLLSNNGITTASFDSGDSYDLDLRDLKNFDILPDDIDVIISSLFKCKLRNVNLDDAITVPTGIYAMQDSGHIAISNDITIQPQETIPPIDYIESYRFKVPVGGLAIGAGQSLDISEYLEKKTQSERKATHYLGYDAKNRLITSEFRNGE